MGSDKFERHRPSSSSNGNGSGKKRKHEDDDEMTELPALPQQPSLPAFNLVGRPSNPSIDDKGKSTDDRGEWQTVDKHTKKKAKKIPKPHSANYPKITFSSQDCRLQTMIKLSDLQNLVLYILADGPSPNFVSVSHRPEIRKVVVLMVPGLEMDMFLPEKAEDSRRHDDRRSRDYRSPDDFYPTRFQPGRLPASLEEFAEMFPHVWPVKTPGDDKYSKMHSPLHAMLQAPLSKDKEERKASKNRNGPSPVKEPHGWKNTRTPVTEFIHSLEELLENNYPIHPAFYETDAQKEAYASHRKLTGIAPEHGWVDTLVQNLDDGTPPDNEIEAGSITAGREILTLDCEMCELEVEAGAPKETALIRISVLAWDGTVVMDELVKPSRKVGDYMEKYSGITEKMLAPVTTTLEDIQKKLLELFHPRTILIGHSLESDLNALKMTHPFIIDTAIIFPHARGPPLKQSLKNVAKRYLNREIQKGHGTTGHDSVEDATTCLDLVKQKCEKGKSWGLSEAQSENIFKRVARAGVRYKNNHGSAVPSPISGKSSAAIDWGEPKRGPGAAANFAIGCQSDEEVKEGVIRAVKGDPDGKEIPGGGVDFVWARFRELDALKGWWNFNKPPHAPAALDEDPVKPAKDVKAEGSKDLKPVVNPFSSTSVPSEASNPFLASNNPFSANEHTNKEEITSVETTTEEITKSETITEETTAKETLPSPTDAEMKDSEPTTPSVPPQTKEEALNTAYATLTHRIQAIYNSLPPCTAFIVYSGSGDPREMSRLQKMHQDFRNEYNARIPWDKISVKWTDVEDQALKSACREARNGVGFITCK